jgi:cytoskeletal protein RodZ
MDARFRSRLVSGLIVSVIGITGAALATAQNTSSSTGSTTAAPATTTTPGTSSMGTTAPDTSTAPPSTTAPSTGTGAAGGATPGTAASPSTTGTTAQDSQAKRIFDQLDVNHDGMLSFDEFSRATFQQK